MDAFTQAVLALAIAHAPPGRSPFSLEAMPECGSSPKEPACEIKPVCDKPVLSCRPPRWSKTWGEWVRIESRSSAIRRYAGIADALVDVSRRLVRCDAGEGASDCEPAGWPQGVRSLARSSLTVALHESALRKDIQLGRGRSGRGPAGEACLMQVAVDQAPLYASWIPRSRRKAISKDPELSEGFAQRLLGDSPRALRRCFEIGMRMLARSRRACGKSSDWAFGMFSMYGSGHTCRLPEIADERVETLRALRSAGSPKLDAEVIELLDERFKAES